MYKVNLDSLATKIVVLLTILWVLTPIYNVYLVHFCPNL